MRFVTRFISSFIFILLVSGAGSAYAQSPAWGDLSFTAGMVDYDLSGTGQTAGFAIRAKKDLTHSIGLELRGLFARPCQQFQSCKDIGPATLFVPEAQLQYRWNLGVLEPFVGAGLGVSALRSSLDTKWDPTVSFSVGTAVRLTERLALNSEFRLRGHEFRFTGSTTEINAGLSWRLPAF